MPLLLPSPLQKRHLAHWVLVFIVCWYFINNTTVVRATEKFEKIELEITTHLGDNQTFVTGDTLSFLVNLSADAYLLVIYETADKQLIQLFPNRFSSNTPYQAGSFLQVPNRMLTKKFEIAPPFGEERVYAFALSKPIPEIEGDMLDNGLLLLNASIQKIKNKLKSYAHDESAAYGENALKIVTRPH